jgi:type IV pilus assembly protein PilC
MPNFSYSAAKQNGEVVKGEREAESEKILAQSLKGEGLLLLRAEASAGSGLSRLNAKIDLAEVISRIRPISMVEKMFFTRNLAVMIAAGLPLTRAMDALAEESTNPKFKKILAQINGSVVAGKTFAESLQIHEKVFGTLFVNMVEVGETTGKLTLVLKLLARQMKKDYDLRRRVKGAMMYPAIIISALVIVGTLMMIYVVPTLTQTIKELGVKLPLSTKIIIFVSDLAAHYILFVVLGFAAFVVIVWRLMKTQKGKELFDRVILKVPLFGSLVKKFNVARFTRTLSYLITSGIPVVRSLDITSRVLGNTLYKRAAEEASRDIQKGKQLNEILGVHTEIFQPVVVQMIKVGEETGNVSDLLLRVALFFEEDVNETTKNLSTIIEPLLMIVIGVAVGFFAVSMLQPIYGSLGNI